MSRALFVFVLTAACVLPVNALATPILTITCHDLKGTSLHYGVPFWERVQAKTQKQPMPLPHVTGPERDGYDNTLTIVVDSASPRKMTIVWNESAETQKLRADAKKNGIDMIPPTVAEAQIVAVNRDMFVALIADDPQGASLYTFYPKLGSVFISTQGEIPDATDSVMTSVRGSCEFSGNPYERLQ
jgi:hypothetical protein